MSTTTSRDPWLVSKTFALAGVSNMVSGAITHPIDVVKVRMQCDPGRGAARQYSGLVSGATRVRKRGFGMIYSHPLASKSQESRV